MPGFIFRAHDQRLYERFVEGFRFSATWPTQPKLAPRQLALLSSAGNAFEAVALMKRGRRAAATYTWHVSFDPVRPFDAEIPLGEFLNTLQPDPRERVLQVIRSGGGQIPDDLMDALLEAILHARPDAAYQIEEIRRLAGESPPLNRLGDREGQPIVLYEADAFALALETAGLDRNEELQMWAGTPEIPFIQGIQDLRVSEDRLIEHDARHFGDWRILEPALVGGASFESKQGQHLTVINVNREPIERTLGVDLIYYNHAYDCYVLVQYKRMQKQDNGESEFRPDDQLEEELARMRTIVLDDTEPAEADAYRLDHHCCYLKLCWPTTKEFHAGDIVEGMYFPLSYWDLLVRSPQAIGPQGGVRLQGSTVGRRLHRTAFVGLVGSAWIGSRGVTSETITEIIRSGLDANRSLILAAGGPTP